MKTHSKIKIIFLLPSLVAGGAERVISFVAQSIDKDKFDTILLVAGFEKDSAYDVSNVNVVYLNKPRILTALPSIIKYIIKQKPEVVVSSISHVNTAMSMISPLFKNTKFIGREATVLSKRKNEEKSRKWSPAYFLPNGFKNLDMLICQSQDMAEDMVSNFEVPKDKVCVINNPISKLPPVKQKTDFGEIKKYITVGRLTEVKGHIRILEMLSMLKTPFEYTIIGDGSLKDKIFEKAKELKLDSSITHIPFTNKVNDYIAKNDMFLQGSYVEGFPNALLESCVVGTPVIAFNAPGGTKEIVENGINGFLVDNKDEFLKRLNENRTWNPKKVSDSVYQKFNKERILQQYETLFFNVLNKSA
ncbi:glycosyltransferase [Winogradskyella sp. PG-2]|uniref:glycosyltransferase n=1 Tax=Winogradskyella sp. PG-2 TaxID=754409 RepID=UPI000458873F|nr:glycosyltransferase [Winogradskyella sp. PG-2]BAO77453.1 alpha-1,4-N-acetylgalactosamine transferase PglJ [Winogradskyella sp. PG-2]